MDYLDCIVKTYRYENEDKGGPYMDIAALSMGLSQTKVAQQASISVMKMAMDTAKGQASDLASLLESSTTKVSDNSLTPHLGRNIDTNV